ncbi:hypothetical protein MEQU1_000072 [Malassezia equina]|uniref:Nucleoporin Nup54 alpha-helical domain-containing protein n=1 Tax=Malassezia equina TaxID=1381935 RepID=A0AAF0EBP6_9BASI|nr:hypothetical protein MEQU1_000072 [Malassezia equina]
MFGASSGSVFGSAPSSQPGQQGSSLFGASSSGAQPTQQPPAGTSLFGSQTNTQNKTATAPSTGIFGASTNNASGTMFGNAPSGTTGTTFNNPSAQGQTGGLFGQSAAPGQNASAPLGAAAPVTQNQGGAGLFGNSQAGQPTGGLFGLSQAQGTSNGGLFGAAPTQAQGGGLFGNTQTNATQSGGLFGASQSQPSTGGLFGAKPALGASTTTNPLGTSTSTLSTSQTAMPNAVAQPAQDKKLGAPLNAQLERIAMSWDTSNLSTCQFQYYLYNRAPDPASQQQLCVRRPDAVGPMHDALWAKALQENPEPDRLYPVLAVGFGDLQTRANAQMAEATRQRNKVAELTKQLATLQQKHDLSNAVRAQTAMMTQMRIHQRLLSLVKDSSFLIPALRGQSLTATEDMVKASLENCEAQLNGTVGDFAAPATEHAHLRAQLNSLWAQLGVVRARREAMQAQNPGGGTEWVVVDESSFDEIAHILNSLQQGLVHLTNTLNSDAKALDIVCDGLKGVPLVGVRHR